jgi:hypothetical protein
VQQGDQQESLLNSTGLFLFTRLLNSSSFSHPHHLVEAPPCEVRPGRKRAPTPEELRRRHLISRKPGRSSSSHTLGPTEPRLDHSYQQRRVTSTVRHRTLRDAGTGQIAPIYRTEINVVLSLQIFYLSPFRAPIWTPEVCFVADPTFWAFWVVIVLLKNTNSPKVL